MVLNRIASMVEDSHRISVFAYTKWQSFQKNLKTYKFTNLQYIESKQQQQYE